MKFVGVYYRIGGRTCLNGLSFAIRQPLEPTILLGANGAGKTLTLKLMQGVITASDGEVGGFNLPKQVMIFQKPLVLNRSCKNNLLFFLKAAGFSRKLALARAAAAFRWSGLGRRADEPAKSLSTGQQQLLALARAYALEPKALLLDEPTANLDPKATRLVEELVLNITKKGCKVIMTTQSIAQARRLGAEIIFIVGGRLSEQNSATAFFKTSVAARYGL